MSGHAAITDDAYDAMPPFQWGKKRYFADGAFPTETGRANFVAVHSAAAKESDASYPFTLNTGRLRDQWHTMTRTGAVPALMESAAEARFTLSPEDAAAQNITEGALIRVTTRHASAILPAAISPAQRRREIFGAMHWTDAHSSAGSANRLVGAARDPVSASPLPNTNARPSSCCRPSGTARCKPASSPPRKASSGPPACPWLKTCTA